MAIEGAHLIVQVTQIQEAIHAPDEVIGRNIRLEIERVEQPGMSLLLSSIPNSPKPNNPRESEALAPIKPRVFQQNQPEGAA